MNITPNPAQPQTSGSRPAALDVIAEDRRPSPGEERMNIMPNPIPPETNGSQPAALDGITDGCRPLPDEEGTDDLGPPPAVMPFRVKVIRSANRHKTVSSRITGGVLEIRIPAWMSDLDEAEVVNHFRRRFDERHRCWEVDLAARARDLAARHDLREPRSIRWSTRQRRRWGSCSTTTGEILISHRLTEVPPWVLDYVIVHELAHLVEARHSAAFHELVDRYPLAERAMGYLEAFGAWSGGILDRQPTG